MQTKRPYKLPEPLLCDRQEVTMELVNDYIRRHESRFPRYEYLENLYKGFHDVFNLPEKEDWKPDNRLAVNLPKYITDVFLGFAYGIPVKRSHPNDSINEAIAEFDKANRMAEHDYEMAKKVCKYGHAFEYFYQDENAKTRVSDHTPKEIFVVYENSLRKAALFAVRYGYKDSGERYGEILEPDRIREFNGSIIGEERENPYGKINVVEWLMNEERMGIYEEVAGMVESLNSTIGEKANDVMAFAEAYLAILGAEIDEEGVRRIRDNRLINLYGTDDAKDILVQFLQKPTADGTQENLLDRLERLIHKISMVPDINSESFGSDSGIALEYKLHSMRDLAKVMDEKVFKSMSKRYKLFCTLTTNVPDRKAWEEIEYTSTRNIPRNIKEEAETAKALEGIVSKETQLKTLSVVDNVKDEMAKIKEENKEDQEEMNDRFMTFGNNNNNNPKEVQPNAEKK